MRFSSACVADPVRKRWRLAAGVAALCPLVLVAPAAAGPPAADPPQAAIDAPPPPADPWQTYIDAAVNSTAAGDFASATSLLKAALGVARQADPNGARATLTRFLLKYTYVLQDRADDAKVIAAGGFGLDFDLLRENFLPLVSALNNFADHAYTHSLELTKAKQNPAKATTLMSFAADCLLLETTIYKNTMPDGSIDAAAAVVFSGLVAQKQGDLTGSIDRLNKALQMWDRLAARDQQLSVGSRRLTLFQQRISAVTGPRDDPALVRIVLAHEHAWRAVNELKDEKTEQAATDFTEAEALYKQSIAELEIIWPGHTNVANLYWHLGYMYETETRMPEAEQAYRHGLDLYTAIEGMTGDSAMDTASYLAKLLRKQNKITEAAELERSYGLAKPN